MPFSNKEILKIIKGKLLNPHLTEGAIEHLLIDSRRVVFPESSLFFALKGSRQDGHDFIDDAYQKGVRNFVVSKDVEWQLYPFSNFIQVENSVEALQQLATFHRSQFSLPIIGITGSNGKTIIKEWLFQLLRKEHRIVRSPKSYNSQIGVPLSVWHIDKDDELGIIEAGISTTGEMDKITPVVNCDLGIFTNIGPAHSEGFSSLEEKLLEKIQLFSPAKTIVFCDDDALVRQAINEKYSGKHLFSWTRKNSDNLPKSSLQIISEIVEKGQTKIAAKHLGKSISIIIPFSDPASIENAVQCWATMLHLGYDNKIIAERMMLLEPIAMRLELKKGAYNCLIINDSYNSDFGSLKIALDFMEQQSAHNKRTLILSDILQSGESAETLYEGVAKLILTKKVSKLIGIGKEVGFLKNLLPSSFEQHFFAGTNDFLEQYDFQKFSDETILLKGARKFVFERIANRMARKVHNTILEIDLDAMKHNLNVFASCLRPGVKMVVFHCRLIEGSHPRIQY